MATRLRWSQDGTRLYGYDILNPLTRNEKTATDKTNLDNDKTWPGAVDTNGWHTSWIMQFPAIVQISKLIANFTNYGGGNNIKISSDSTDGVDGSWTVVNTDSIPTLNVYQEFTLSPVSDCRWMKFTIYQDYHGIPLRALWLFGEYIDRYFEFWDSSESAEFTAEYPLALPDARNDADYSERVQFKLKNVDSVQHDFTVSIAAVRPGGDSTVTNYITLSDNGGSSKSSSVNISALGAGAFSTTLDVWGDLLKANNPADGHHYFAINVEVTA